MNAISLYIQTCRYVMQAQANDTSTWEDLYRYLPYLRQSLSCCVCTNVLLCPMGPIESKCQHHVCRDCRGGKMRLRPSCSWCKNWQEYVENSQLRLIVQCFKKLCDYLASSFITQHLINNSQSGDNTLLSIITEGRTVNDDYSFTPSASLAVPNLLPSKISASNGTISSVVTVKQEPIDTTQHDNTDTAPICDIPNTNTERCDEIDAHAGASDQLNSTPDAEELSKVTSTSGPEPPDNLVTSSSTSISNSDTQQGDNVGPADEQSEESPPAQNGISEDTEEIQDAVMAPHSIHLEHSQHQQPSCSSSEPASSGPNSPNYDLYSRGGHAASAGEQEYNKETYAGIYSVSMSNDHAPKLKIRRTDRGQHHIPSTSSNSGIDQAPRESSHSAEYKHKSRSKVKQKNKLIGCRCGLATPTPGKLTCCGQRCPCYSAFKGCLPECRCRGCRNPRKVQIFEDAPELSPNEDDDSDADDDSEIEVDV